jgi:adenylosuccinate lyase
MQEQQRHEYESPFSARYASPEMSRLFSQDFRSILFRKLWISLAKAQSSLGLPITPSQISQMETHSEHIDAPRIREYEKRFRHDVMAEIHAFGDLCPEAKPILHLGATSCYVTDNADLIQLRGALALLHQKLIHLLRYLSAFAESHADEPCLSYTHYQSAQPTTFGKRACLWLQDYLWDALEWDRIGKSLPFLGAKGATGTQSSFLSLFRGDSSKIEKMEQYIAEDFGFTKVLPISGQTYTRKVDLTVLNSLESFASSSHKMGTDIRLLSHDGELLESFEETQVGSSAMPYKRNPVYSERICGLSRFIISLSGNAAQTLATQWLERSLDDSSNRRLSLPESFLGADSILNLLIHVVTHLKAAPKVALEKIHATLPLLAMENILMEAVKKGGNRQDLHEKLRRLSAQPSPNLAAEIEKDRDFRLNKNEIEPLLSIRSLIGRAPEQVSEFLEKEIRPYLNLHKETKVPIYPVEI